MLPIITFAPIPADLEVSESKLAATCAFDIAPNGKAPEVIRKVACVRMHQLAGPASIFPFFQTDPS